MRPSASAAIDGLETDQCRISSGRSIDDESYSKGLAQGIRDFVSRTNDVSADDLTAWHSEFERLAEAEQYFFSTNRYIFKASKSAGAPT